MSLLSQLIEKREAAQAELDALLDSAETESRDLNETETTEFDAKADEIRSLDERITTLAETEERKAKAAEIAAKVVKPSPAVVTSEPTTYRKGGSESYFRDLFRAGRGD